MNVFLRPIILVWLTVFSCVTPVLGADTNTPPKAETLVHAGKETLQKLLHTPASWTVKCRLPNEVILQIEVVCDSDRKSRIFTQIANPAPQKICRMIQSDGLWYIQEKNDFRKCRPYEAELHFPAAYLFLSLSDLKCIVDETQVSAATFQRRDGGKLLYRMPLATQNRRALEKVVSEYEKLGTQNPSFLERKDVAQTLRQARTQLTNGIPLGVDEKTGILLETKLQEITVTVEGFRWLAEAPAEAFALPKNTRWDDQSRPWPDSDYENCIMVGHDPVFVMDGVSKLSVDGYVLNLRTEQLRRVPYRGFVTFPGCFLKDRREVIVAGLDPASGMGMLKVNLATGRNEAINYGEFNGGISLMAEFSPDGKKIATMRSLSGGSITDLQIQLIELQTGNLQNLGTPGPIGAPFSWLPDSDGLILKRYEHTNDLNAVETRILCRLGFDGKLTDLRHGDWPVVLRTARKILYEDNETSLWHTCDLDGSHPELFADGLKGHAMPAVSPDESKIIFAYYQKGKFPQLMLYDMGSAKGTPTAHVEGFTSMPVWR